MIKEPFNQLDKIFWAFEYCEASGYEASDHIRGVTKLIGRAV